MRITREEERILVNKTKRALEIYNDIPKRRKKIKNADTFLYDIFGKKCNVDFSAPYLGKSILELFIACTDRQAFINLFDIFTDMHYKEFVEKCINETTR